jgi:hypothetical protein
MTITTQCAAKARKPIINKGLVFYGVVPVKNDIFTGCSTSKTVRIGFCGEHQRGLTVQSVMDVQQRYYLTFWLGVFSGV